jgi:5-methylthioadenosine/S-adenosylhomocysteine deaminase
LYHPESHLVYAVRGADVSHVMVDGRVLVEHGRLVHMDEKAVMAAVSRIAQRVGQTDKQQA